MKKISFKKKRLKSNSAFAIAAGCAVAFMLIVTIVSVLMYSHRMRDVQNLVSDSSYKSLDKYVVFISSDDDSDYWQQVYKAAKEEGEQHGIYVDMLSESLNGTYSETDLLEMAIYSGCDGILLEGNDSDDMATFLQKASNMGIPIITMNSDCDNENRISYVGVNSYSISKLYAEELVGLLQEETSVLILKDQSIEEEKSSIIINGIQEAVNDYILLEDEREEKQVDFEVSDVLGDEAFSTEEYVRNILLSDNLPDVIICLDELSTTCVYQALIDYNLVGKIQLLGYYESQTILEGISQRVITGSVTVDAAEVGDRAIEAFNEYSETGYVSDYISIEVSLIDYQNVEKYMEAEDE